MGEQMNGRIAKKVRKYTRRNFLQYASEVKKWSFITRWRFCWYILFHRLPKTKKVSKDQVLRERRPVPAR